MLPTHTTEQKITFRKEGIYYGIDLGTTYTVIAQIDLSERDPMKQELPLKLLTIPQHSPLEMDGSDRSDMVASVLGVGQDDRMFVGNKLYRLKGYPGFVKDKNLFYHWKLDLGVSVKPLYKEAIKSELDDAAKVAGKILNYCRIHSVGKEKEWENVIVTVPASFQANQRNDVLTAISYAQIKQEPNMLIDEPNAAFIGYLNQLSLAEKQDLLHEGSKRVLVIDFGGGTCDLSILQIQSPDKLEMKISNLAISRYNDLGGQDLDMIIAEKYLLPFFSKEHSSTQFQATELEKYIIPQLAVMAEKLKIDLSRTLSSRYQDINRIPVDGNELSATLKDQEVVLKSKSFPIKKLSLTEKEFSDVTRFIFTDKEYKLEVVDKVIQSVPSVVDDILRKANLAKTDIDYILFAGGSVQNLLFVKETSELLPQAKVLLPRRPDVLVAHGAAIYSFYRNALGVELLRPICSETIGITTQNAPFFPLIEAGVGLPAEVNLPSFRVQGFNQRRVTIPFCIGRADKVVRILTFDIPNLVTPDTEISIKAILTVDKLLEAEIWIGDQKMAGARLTNPFVLANVSEEERQVSESLEKLQKAQEEGDRNVERRVMRALLWEYYNLGNYTRTVSLGEEWLGKFSATDPYVYNIIHCACDALGQRRKGKEILEKGLKYSPDNSTLRYNMSLIVEREEGTQKTIEYLTQLPLTLHESTDIKFRMALLNLSQNDEKNAREIGQEYQDGRYGYLNEFDRNLLKQILEKLNIPCNQTEGLAQQKKSSFAQGDLLRVKSELPV